MSTATTVKPVNLSQLGAELGGSPSFRAVGPREDGTTTITTDDVDQSTLEAAVAAHVAQPIPDDPEPEPAGDHPLDADLLATAEAARRAAYDAVIAAGNGVMSMARLRDADRAGSEAFLTALGPT